MLGNVETRELFISVDTQAQGLLHGPSPLTDPHNGDTSRTATENTGSGGAP